MFRVAFTESNQSKLSQSSFSTCGRPFKVKVMLWFKALRLGMGTQSVHSQSAAVLPAPKTGSSDQLQQRIPQKGI